jgi:surfactin synthase thioesterase subunit
MSDADRWVRRFRPAPGAATRLLCLPHAGGAASYYLPVSQALTPAIDVLAVQYPGRQDRLAEPPVDSVDQLADLLVPLLDSYLDRPLTIFGHSLGASVAFEVARRLEARGVVPAALFVSGRRAPSRGRDEHVHLLDDAGLLAEVKSLEGTDTAVFDDPELVRMVLPTLRNDYRAAETYRWRPGPPLTCPVHALIGDADPRVTVEEAGAWAEHTSGEFTLTTFSGGHFYLTEHLPAVLERLAG